MKCIFVGVEGDSLRDGHNEPSAIEPSVSELGSISARHASKFVQLELKTS